MNLNASNARMAIRTSQTLASHVRAARVGRRPERRSLSLLLVVLLGSLALTACGPGESSRLVVTQSTDVPSGADHKGHLAPGVFMGITLSIRNTGAGPARAVTVEDVPPAGVCFFHLTPPCG